MGRTHKPYHRTFAYEHEGETHYRHALSIGLVGKPKDAEPRAAYQLLPLDEQTTLPNPGRVRLVKVAYMQSQAEIYCWRKPSLSSLLKVRVSLIATFSAGVG